MIRRRTILVKLENNDVVVRITCAGRYEACVMYDDLCERLSKGDAFNIGIYPKVARKKISAIRK